LKNGSRNAQPEMQDMQEGSGVGVPHIRNQWHCKVQATACIAQVLMPCDVDLLAQAVWRRLSLMQQAQRALSALWDFKTLVATCA